MLFIKLKPVFNIYCTSSMISFDQKNIFMTTPFFYLKQI